RIDRLSGLIVQPSAVPDCVSLFRIDSGQIFGPMPLHIQVTEHTKSQSMDARVQEVLRNVEREGPRTATAVMEHLAILKRWYYRSNRIGEIFFADDKDTLPMRRIVRGISRVFRGEEPEAGNILNAPVIDAAFEQKPLS
ncbi:MAG: UvrB/UvrC protein, partial [Acidobacteriaceae bacterium]|nr:UvrB/UvrC protein [Acidobacteriaceae bacterium]